MRDLEQQELRAAAPADVVPLHLDVGLDCDDGLLVQRHGPSPAG